MIYVIYCRVVYALNALLKVCCVFILCEWLQNFSTHLLAISIEGVILMLKENKEQFHSFSKHLECGLHYTTHVLHIY